MLSPGAPRPAPTLPSAPPPALTLDSEVPTKQNKNDKKEPVRDQCRFNKVAKKENSSKASKQAGAGTHKVTLKARETYPQSERLCVPVYTSKNRAVPGSAGLRLQVLERVRQEH